VTPSEEDEATTLRQRGLQELEVRARLVGDAGAAVLCGDLTDDLRARARVAAHRSIGLAGALGEADLAEPARHAEQLLLADRALGVADAVVLCEVAAQLEDEARARVDTAPQRDARAASRGLVGGLVAIVDDDEILVALVRLRLERAGFQVLTYDHGGVALRELTARTAAPDVLLLDVDLPGMNGLSVLDGLAAAGALEHTRVVLATVHDNEAELARARAAVPDVDHLPKPYDLDRVVAMVTAKSRSGP
jgi:CheY-like chemotaxis protein